MKVKKWVVRAMLIAVLALLGLTVWIVIQMATAISARAAEWNKWNVTPYATSQEKACKKAPAAVKGFNMPEAAKEYFIKVLGSACSGGTEVWLTPNRQLEQMWSGGQKSHVMNKVTVGELPVLKSPDGRSYRKGAVAETAKAQSWSFVHDGKTYVLYLPSVCFNWSWAFGPEAQTFAQVGQCPDVYTLKVNVWKNSALKLPGVELTHAKEELGERKFAIAPRVSRTHGGQFRRAYAAGQLERSEMPLAFRVSLIMTPESQGGSPEITKEEVFGDIVVTGLRELQFARAQLEQWDAIRVIAMNGDVISPPRHSGTGLKELRFFNRLPGTRLGEWDNNPAPDCIMNVHSIELAWR